MIFEIVEIETNRLTLRGSASDVAEVVEQMGAVARSGNSCRVVLEVVARPDWVAEESEEARAERMAALPRTGVHVERMGDGGYRYTPISLVDPLEEESEGA